MFFALLGVPWVPLKDLTEKESGASWKKKNEKFDCNVILEGGGKAPECHSDLVSSQKLQ